MFPIKIIRIIFSIPKTNHSKSNSSKDGKLLIIGILSILLCDKSNSCKDVNSQLFGIFSIFIAIFLVFTHRENIKRMINGNENQFKKVMIFSILGILPISDL